MTTKRRGKGDGSITNLPNGHYKSALKVDWVTVPSETQMQRILQEAKEDDYVVPEGDFKLYTLFLLAVVIGARLGELLDLDIDLKTNTIHIDTQLTREGTSQPLKTSAEHRRIFVQPEVLRAVLEVG